MPSVYPFPFRRLRVPGARPAFRPILDVRLQGLRGSIRTRMLVDSGADCAVIDSNLARHLGLTREAKTQGRGVAGRVEAWRSRVTVQIDHPAGVLPTVEVPVEVPVEGTPPIAVLGREGFFEAFDIVFQMGPEPERGMFGLVPHATGRRVFPRRRARPRRHRARLAA